MRQSKRGRRRRRRRRRGDRRIRAQIAERKGEITLAEGPWPTKAYFDANTRAQERDAGHYVNYKITEPRVISRGAYPQIQGTDPTIVPENPEAYLDTQIPELEKN